ncbi:MAG: hypothetical protein A2066_08855 [Bacteroidetes bacterium GWB2_41_8]|nr:MAG: hypothetical protein A2066_08855 [Bacteroidetes bacterium GWB2_41_8]
MKYVFYFLFLFAISQQSFAQSTELSESECETEIHRIWHSNLSTHKAQKAASSFCLANPNNPTTLLNLYLLRQHVNKSDLKNALYKVSPENKSNDYAKSLEVYLENDQIKKGNKCYDFIAVTSKGEEFRFSDIVRTKDVFLIFGGLDCMGEDSRNALIDIYGKLNRNNVEIVSFAYESNEKELNKVVEEYQVPWLVVSDFQGDHSKTKIIYDAQVRPTSLYINSSGKVVVSATKGLSRKAIKLMKKHIIE